MIVVTMTIAARSVVRYLLTAVLLLLLFKHAVVDAAKKDNLVVVTVATHITEGFLRFNRSLDLYGLKKEVLGLNQEWKGGDITRQPGGGQKILLFRKYLESVQDQKDLIVLFTDSYDVIVCGGPDQILTQFYLFESNLVFSSEKYCWPDASLESKYPKSDGKRFLNSGAFIGYAPQLYSIVTEKKIENEDDDQLYYTNLYLDATLREKLSIKLDLNSILFQNLNGALNDVEIRFSQSSTIDETNADAFLYNKVYQTQPIVVHGNGNSKTPLNSLGNYLAKSWHPATGCLSCSEGRLDLDRLPLKKYPLVVIALNILKPTPFFAEFLEDLTALDYPKDRIMLFIQALTDHHSTEIERFMDDHRRFYNSIRYAANEKEVEWQLRNRYLDECIRVGGEYLFVWDSEARLINARTLRTLIEENKSVIAPMLTRPNQLWSNFWGALTHDGFYSRSHDYVQIVKNERRGIWNVPHISSVYLVNASVFDTENRVYNYEPLSYRAGPRGDGDVDADMQFCRTLRANGIFIYVSNLYDFGHLSHMETYDSARKHADFYEIYANEIEWRRRYIHENYTKVLLGGVGDIEQPCTDVYWFPLVSPHFCQHLIEIMENFGQWSPGKNYDPRLEGGYESVPTRDIHMKQVDLEQHWLYFLKKYIEPVQEKIFIGYSHDPPRAIMNFVVRYHPDEQASLRPHHDASTYTINIALNRPKIDYEGGGCRFLRYNCSVTDLRLGWSLIHPGRLTHYHEGLTVTKGVRYIMVSFVDP